jgi:hypothetical protein
MHEMTNRPWNISSNYSQPCEYIKDENRNFSKYQRAWYHVEINRVNITLSVLRCVVALGLLVILVVQVNRNEPTHDAHGIVFG